MGLTAIAFAVAIALIAILVPLAGRARGATSGRYAVLIVLGLAAFSLLSGLSSVAAALGDNTGAAPLILSRLAGAAMAFSSAALLGFAFSFSTGSRLLAGIATGIALVAGAFAAWRLLFTGDYMSAVAMAPTGEVLRIEGRRYILVNDLMAGAALLSALVHLPKGVAGKDRIQRQRSTIAFLGIAAGMASYWVFARAFPTRSGIRTSFSLLPVSALAIGASVAYAFSQSRVFDWRAIGRSIISYGALALIVGAPVGLALQGLALLGHETWAYAPLVGAPLVFALAYFLAGRFAGRFLARLGSLGDYRERLEGELSRIDLSEGRDAVLDRLYALLSGTLDFSEFSILIADDRGTLRAAFPTEGGRPPIAPDSPLAEALEASQAGVVVKSEAVAAASLGSVGGAELLGLFESLDAEALVVAREGRRVIGLFALGARRTGAEYTAYDYASFKAIYGKLFVIAYYLKNIARESLMTTVDREIALSDQIVRFALEKVDRIDHPKADAAWVARSTRSLGGDFIDFVRLSPDRWFVVMGDVSGKGLSASMNMLILKSMIRTFLRVEKDFVGLVARVNAFIKENLPKGTFFAGLFGYLDFSKEAFYYINCGVPAILLYSPGFDTFIEVQGEGKILGFVKDVSAFLKPRKLALSPGSALVTSTDGIMDGENLRGERYGKERLLRSVRGRLALPAAEICAGAIDDFLAHTDKRLEDDITLLVMKLNPRSPA